MSPALLGLGLLTGLLGGWFGGGDCAGAEGAAAERMQRIERQWPLRPAADPVSRYLQALGERLAGAGSARGWRFAVLQNLEPSGFAVGSGRFVLSDGLIAFVRSESELAAVIAHEIAHQRLGHFCAEDSASARAVRLGAVTQHYDLALEREADAEAVRILAAAGFDPAAMAGVLGCLRQRPGAAAADLRGREQALSRQTEALPAGAARADSAAFRQVRARLAERLGAQLPRCQ